jgi:hypothetical protein
MNTELHLFIFSEKGICYSKNANKRQNEIIEEGRNIIRG